MTFLEKKYVIDYLNKRGFNKVLEDSQYLEVFEWISYQKFFNSGKRDVSGRFIHAEGNLDFKIPKIDNELNFIKSSEIKYPDGKKFAVCLTHDVDVVNRYIKSGELVNFFKKIKNKNNFSNYGIKNYLNQSIRKVIRYSISTINIKDPLHRYEDWLNLEDKYGFKSTFMFFSNPISNAHFIDCDYSLEDNVIFNKVKMKVSEMVTKINSLGWEIGLHGSYYSALSENLLLEQKTKLEDLIDEAIISSRQHYLHFDYKKTPLIYENIGLKVDSTIGFNYSYGINQGSMHPFFLWNFEKSIQSNVFEIPLNLMDSSMFKSTNTVKEVDKILENCLSIINFAEKTNGVVTLNWHPNYIILKDRWIVYETLLQEIKIRNGWGTTMKNIYELNKNVSEN